MNILFDKSFSKSLDKIKSSTIKIKVEELIVELENVKTINEVPSLKKMTGNRSYFRKRIGDYRLGIEIESSNTIRFIVIAHRKDIYRIFP